MYGFLELENGGLEWLPNDVGFIPNQILNAKNLSFIVSGTLACTRMLVYAYVCMKHALASLEHACTYMCMHTHALGFLWPFFSKNSLFGS